MKKFIITIVVLSNCFFAVCLLARDSRDAERVNMQTQTEKGVQKMHKERYLDLMEKALSAYSREHIERYIRQVKQNGLTEHGFPRLGANLGILMAHGRCLELKPYFLEIMDLCCQQIPKVDAANDFSVKEIIFCFQELEKTDVIPAEKLEEWKTLFRTIDPQKCYHEFATKPEDVVYNWAAFSMVSEYMRKITGLTDSSDEFIDLQAYSQLRHLDENKMYRDPNEPMVYDLVTRGLFAVLLDLGYQGKYKQVWQEALDQTSMPTLLMQSVTGELPYGGRSNQFLHNESHVALMMEYYAKRYARLGDLETAGKFKAAAIRAADHIAEWMEKTPISHVKNRFPINSGEVFGSSYGCEFYAYFDKYMITTASFLYVAYRFCDESIPVRPLDDLTGQSWKSSDYFHKLFFRAGEYFAEYDDKADYHYDCSGLGRLHRKGAPSEICISAPCPAGKPSYAIDLESPSALSIAPGIICGGDWLYGSEAKVSHTVKSHFAKGETAGAEIECSFPDGKTVSSSYLLDRNGLQIRMTGSDRLRCLLPVFRFNGKDRTKVNQTENVLEVIFGGYVCRYTVLNGTIIDLNRPARNRNGHYDTFAAEGGDGLTVQISIEKR